MGKNLPIGEDKEEETEALREEVLPQVPEQPGQSNQEHKHLDEGILEGGKQLEGGRMDIFVDGVGH